LTHHLSFGRGLVVGEREKGEGKSEGSLRSSITYKISFFSVFVGLGEVRSLEKRQVKAWGKKKNDKSSK